MKIETSTSYPTDLDLDLSWAFAVLSRRRAQIAAFVMIALCGAGFAILLASPTYTASAVLLLETQPPGLFRSNSVFSERIDAPMVDTQVEVLRSSQLILRVIDDMKLLENAEFQANDISIPGPFDLASMLKEWTTGQINALFASTESATTPAAPQEDPRRALLTNLAKNLEVARVGSSNTIGISYTAQDPITAAAIVNRLAHVYITGQLAWQPENAQAEIPQIEDRVLITKASPPSSPSGPRKALIVAGALLLGLFAGLATAFSREWLDESLQSPEQIERITAVRCLAMLPKTTKKHRHTTKGPTPPKSFSSAELPIISDVLANPVSAFSDGIRRIAVSVRNNRTGQSARIVAITSVARADGKTTIAASVALLLAQTQGPTLLIDGDLRGRGATRLLAPEASIGLRDGVNGTFPLATLLWSDTNSPLRFLPSIVSGVPEHPADVLGAAGMEQLLRQAGKTFRNIVIDLPALGAVIDAQAIFPSIDALLLTVAKGSPANALYAVMEAAPALREKLSGAILNKA